MPTTQETLESAFIARKRSLYDLQISRIGITVYTFRYFDEEDSDGDLITHELISQESIEVKIDYPGDVPLFRGRSSASNTADSNGLYLYDILPIQIYFKFADTLEVGDYLLHTITDSNGNKDVITLRISEIVGSFLTKIVHKRADAAPYNGEIPDEVQTKIDELLA